jgi:hypothetical protein
MKMTSSSSITSSSKKEEQRRRRPYSVAAAAEAGKRVMEHMTGKKVVQIEVRRNDDNVVCDFRFTVLDDEASGKKSKISISRAFLNGYLSTNFKDLTEENKGTWSKKEHEEEEEETCLKN